MIVSQGKKYMMDISNLGAWAPLLEKECCSTGFAHTMERVEQSYAQGIVFPPKEKLFSAFSLTQPEHIKVVILGQDPYHECNQANGLAFSVQEGVKIPPSLRNIFKELESDLGVSPPPHGDLRGWATQGVFLLNTVLTVEQAHANSHSAYGWQNFTDEVIGQISKLPQPIVFVLWGAQAQKKIPLIVENSHPRLILSAPHPSPLSSYRGFFGSRPFSQINEFLKDNHKTPVDFSL